MILNSIRWRLQIWYGLILLIVLTGFGVTAYQLESSRQLRNIDTELHRHLRMVSGALRTRPPRWSGEERPPFGSEEHPGFEHPSHEGPFEHMPEGAEEFRLTPQQAALFDTTETNGFYFALWNRDSKELARSSNAPATIPMPAAQRGTEPQPMRLRGNLGEVYFITPPGNIILAGRSIASDLSELHHTAWLLVAVGSAVLLIGLAGGWWLASRAIRPIAAISTTAAKISQGDLSQRIDVQDTESELGRLAGVLNSTFARLETAFAQQQQFTSDAAHELRTPLSVIITQLQGTLTRDRSGVEYRETLESCQRAAQRMRQLIESLLELARLDAGQEAIKRLPFDLARTAGDCIELIRPLAAGRGIIIKADLAPARCTGDAERLAQVITNLLSNAIHYNFENGEVTVSTARENGSAKLIVTDNGRGIPAEHLAHIFKRFYRADQARTTVQGRAGLGLAISKSIIETQGGTIEAASEPGKQTTFTVRLPA